MRIICLKLKSPISEQNHDIIINRFLYVNSGAESQLKLPKKIGIESDQHLANFA